MQRIADMACREVSNLLQIADFPGQTWLAGPMSAIQTEPHNGFGANNTHCQDSISFALLLFLCLFQ